MIEILHSLDHSIYFVHQIRNHINPPTAKTKCSNADIGNEYKLKINPSFTSKTISCCFNTIVCRSSTNNCTCVSRTTAPCKHQQQNLQATTTINQQKHVRRHNTIEQEVVSNKTSCHTKRIKSVRKIVALHTCGGNQILVKKPIDSKKSVSSKKPEDIGQLGVGAACNEQNTTKILIGRANWNALKTPQHHLSHCRESWKCNEGALLRRVTCPRCVSVRLLYPRCVCPAPNCGKLTYPVYPAYPICAKRLEYSTCATCLACPACMMYMPTCVPCLLCAVSATHTLPVVCALLVRSATLIVYAAA